MSPLYKRKEISNTDLMNTCSISKGFFHNHSSPKHQTPTLNHHPQERGGYHPVLYCPPPLFPCPSTLLPTRLLLLCFLKSQGYSVALLARQQSPNFTAGYNILHDRVCDYVETPSFGDSPHRYILHVHWRSHYNPVNCSQCFVFLPRTRLLPASCNS